MTMDPLEYGDRLMGECARLRALADQRAPDLDQAGAAVRCTLCAAWWSREQWAEDDQLEHRLLAALVERIRTGPQSCADRSAYRPRAKALSAAKAHGAPD